jgi:hypothetical protein
MQSYCQHLWLKTWESALQWLSTSTPSVIIFGFALPVISWLVINFSKWRHDIMSPFKVLKESRLSAVIIPAAIWILIIGFFGVRTIYYDYVDSQAQIEIANRERDEYKQKLEDLQNPKNPDRLNGRFIQVNLSQLEKKNRLVLFNVEIHNISKDDTGVKDYQGEVSFDGQNSIPLECLALPDSGINVNGNIWNPGHNPPHGLESTHLEAGVILFKFEDKENKLTSIKPTWTLSYKDYSGKPYKISTQESVLSKFTTTASLRHAILCTGLTGSSP